MATHNLLRTFRLFPAWFCAIVLFLPGCAQAPENLVQTALDSVPEAKAAYERQDVKAAEKAAKKAEKALASLERLDRGGKLPPDQSTNMTGKAKTAARSARHFAGLTKEEYQLRETLDGWQVKAYKETRRMVLQQSLAALTLATEKAGTNWNNLGPVQKNLADCGWKLSQLLGKRKPLPDGGPDWAGAASDLRSWSQQAPALMPMFLALVYQVSGFDSLALYEIESMQPASFPSTSNQMFWHAERAFIYDQQGLRRLALREFDRALSLQANASDSSDGPWLLAAILSYRCFIALQEKDLKTADEELSKVLAAIPDNPVTVFLTGERLMADGQWEKAADSLEKRAAGTANEKLAALLAQRAREIRDGRGNARTFLEDRRLVIEVMRHFLAEAAKKSEAAAKCRDLIESAKAFGEQLADKLPK